MLTYPVIISQYCHPCYTFRLLYLTTRTCYKTIFVLYLFSDKYINIISREKSLSCWLENIFLFVIRDDTKSGVEYENFHTVENWNLFFKLTGHREVDFLINQFSWMNGNCKKINYSLPLTIPVDWSIYGDLVIRW